MSDPGRPGFLGLWSGIGLVAANMIGAGVFLSAGFMIQEMSPGWILIAWVVGMVLNMAGARAYAELASLLPRSGGEYRYLSDLAHPLLGYLAGWASLLVGFSAPIAINAIGASEFLATVIGLPDPRVVATVLIAALTAFHSVGLVTSKRTQDLLIALKVVLLLGFVVLGLALGSWRWPTWTPPHGSTHFAAGPFFGSLFWIAFAFTGWNAAAYAAGDFRNPARDAPRAMLIGCAAVGALYVLVNWVFVANLTPADALGVVKTQRPILGHAVSQVLIGPTGAGMMSILVALAMISCMSAMVMVGPRVYATMAEDGFLPRWMAARAGRPPIGSVVFQSVIAVAIVWTHSLKNALGNVGAVLILFSALAAASVLVVRWRRPDLPRPRRFAQLAAALYVVASAWTLVFGFRRLDSTLLVWVGSITVVALVAYAATVRVRRRAG
ncbi:MAG TPA: amino acid permease [Kofleriaceae bacterium]|nr:amino acid permease [Kofleriaceae bacterium]